MKFPKKHLLTFLILLGMLAGVAVGEWVYLSASSDFASSFAQNVKLLTTIFLRLIQMILAPLVLSTLIVGIAKMGDIKAVGLIVVNDKPSSFQNGGGFLHFVNWDNDVVPKDRCSIPRDVLPGIGPCRIDKRSYDHSHKRESIPVTHG